MFGGYSPYGRLGLGMVAKPGINWAGLLTNTSKTLGVINQAIPAFYQVKPIFNNMKTMFRVAKEVNKPTNNNTNNNNNMNYSQYNKNDTNTQIKETNTHINFFA